MNVHAGGDAALMAMKESIVETRRRQAATVSGGESTVDPDPDYTRPFSIATQTYMLWNITNVGLVQKSPRPAFRILGLFADQESALKQARVIAETSRFAVRMATTHEWYTIPREESNAYAEENKAKVVQSLLAHHNILQEHADEFKRRHDALTKGRRPATEFGADAVAQMEHEELSRQQRHRALQAAAAGDTTAIDTTEAELLRLELARIAGTSSERIQPEQHEPVLPPTSLVSYDPMAITASWAQQLANCTGQRTEETFPVSLETRGQKFVCMSVLRDANCTDPTDPVGQEPSIIVFAAFDTEEEARRYNRCVASKQVTDHDIGVTHMYEWEFPHTMGNKNVDQLYRNEVLDSIMRHQRNASKAVREFEETAERSNLKIPRPLEIAPDLSEPAPITYRRPIGS